MKSSFIFSLVLFPMLACFGDTLIENPETGVSISFPANAVQENQFEEGVTYSAGGEMDSSADDVRKTYACRVTRTYSPGYQMTVNWSYLGSMSDDEIFQHYRQEVEKTLSPYYIYSYGTVGWFEQSERLFAKNAADRIQIAIIVKDGIVYHIQTNEKVSRSLSDPQCTLIINGIPGDHDKFLHSFKVNDD